MINASLYPPLTTCPSRAVSVEFLPVACSGSTDENRGRPKKWTRLVTKIKMTCNDFVCVILYMILSPGTISALETCDSDVRIIVFG
jgi:hypothetical protein